MIRKVLVHWGYELVQQNDSLKFIFCLYKNEILSIKKDRLLKEAKNRYHNGHGKEKASKNHKGNKEILKENARNKYRNLPEEKKEIKRAYGKDR